MCLAVNDLALPAAIGRLACSLHMWGCDANGVQLVAGGSRDRHPGDFGGLSGAPLASLDGSFFNFGPPCACYGKRRPSEKACGQI